MLRARYRAQLSAHIGKRYALDPAIVLFSRCASGRATDRPPAKRNQNYRNAADSWQCAAPPLISRAMENILPILIADAPEALIELCGVNLLERLLRILQRLGFRRAVVFSITPKIVGVELAKRSWARRSCPARNWTADCATALGTKPVGTFVNSASKYLL